MPLLHELPFNQVIATRGNSRLEHWVEGQPLQPESMTDELARWAGDLLGTLHTLDWTDCDYVRTAPSTEWYLERIRFNLDYSATRDRLPPDCARSILDIAIAHIPDNPGCGLVHTDFSADNIVIDNHGLPVVVDNEHLTLGALDYDLARCWYAWPMTGQQRRAFAAAYQVHRTPESTDFLFWAIYSLTQSARIRTKHGYDARQPLQALLLLAEGRLPPLWPQFAALRLPGRGRG